VTAPFTGYRTGLRPEWIDYNGHLNDSAYAVICSQANELFLDSLDLGAAYRARTGCALYTVEANLRYLAEVGPDAELTGESTIAGLDAKRLRVQTSLLDSGRTRVFTGEYLYLHVDGSAGRVAPFPAEVAARLAVVGPSAAG